MKLLVETTGEFQLYLPGPEQFAQAHRPSVVLPTHFIQTHLAGKRLTVLGQVSDEATDIEFAQYLAESGDKALAVEAFLAAFKYAADPPEPHETPPPPAPTPSKAKAEK